MNTTMHDKQIQTAPVTINMHREAHYDCLTLQPLKKPIFFTHPHIEQALIFYSLQVENNYPYDNEKSTLR